MGKHYGELNIDSPMTTSNWIDLSAIVVNAALAWWIVRTMQNRLTNKRTLKDHFINEIKEIRSEYKTCLTQLYSNQTKPKLLLPWFKLMNIKVDDLVKFLNNKYKVDVKILQPYQNGLRELITENADYIAQFNSDKPLDLSDASKTELVVFQQNNNHIFNEIIIRINDSD